MAPPHLPSTPPHKTNVNCEIFTSFPEHARTVIHTHKDLPCIPTCISEQTFIGLVVRRNPFITPTMAPPHAKHSCEKKIVPPTAQELYEDHAIWDKEIEWDGQSKRSTLRFPIYQVSPLSKVNPSPHLDLPQQHPNNPPRPCPSNARRLTIPYKQ